MGQEMAQFCNHWCLILLDRWVQWALRNLRHAPKWHRTY
ncbi:MAG: hypothetical protein RLZZ518_1443, partial [Actinomycetota bacterium]